MLFLIIFFFFFLHAAAADISKPGCPSKCGDIPIPYPFGINSSCSLNPFFSVHCDSSFSPPKPFLSVDTLQIAHISDSTLHIKNRVAVNCYTDPSQPPSVRGHEVVEAGDHVNPFGAREMAKEVRAPACTPEKFVVESANKVKDHKGTWRDVLMNGIVKKST